MRQALTIGIDWKDKTTILSGPDVPFQKQREQIHTMNTKGLLKEFKTVIFTQSDGWKIFKNKVGQVKKAVSAVFLAVASFACLSATAQDVRYVSDLYTSGFTRIGAAAVATNISAYSTSLDVRKTKTVTLQFSLSHSAAGTNCNLNFWGSTDNSNWDTNQTTQFVVSVPYGAVGVNVYSTNLSVGGVGWLKLMTVDANYDADSIVTNNWIRYSYKIGAP